MTDDKQEITSKLNAIIEDMAKLKHLMQLLLREKTTNAVEVIVEMVKKTPGIALDSQRVQRELGKSRPWTIELMKRAALLSPNMKFLPGDKASQTSCRVVWGKETYLQHFVQIQRRVEEKGAMTMGEIMSMFAVERKIARLMAESFCQHYPESRVVESPTYRRGSRWEDAIQIQHTVRNVEK